MKNDAAVELDLVREAKISDLFKASKDKRYEASGVHLKDGYLHIVFDNLPHIMLLRPDWYQATEEPNVLVLKGKGAGYEGITYQPETRRWYCLIEAAKKKSGKYMPRVDVFDETFGFIESHWLDFPLETGNKGFEGLLMLCYRGYDYLLGLYEGDDAESGKAGDEAGRGRIQVFEQGKGRWKHAGTLKLPEVVRFKDYSSIDFSNRYVTVLSQESSAMWVGRVRDEPTSFDDLFEDEGKLFLFPRDDKGRPLYCNLEGVAWIGDDRLAVVSDKKKPKQPGRCADKDQSIHIFKLPDGFVR